MTVMMIVLVVMTIPNRVVQISDNALHFTETSTIALPLEKTTSLPVG
jgi:hypothetical protein